MPRLLKRILKRRAGSAKIRPASIHSDPHLSDSKYQDSNLRILVPETSLFSHLWTILLRSEISNFKFDMASGKRFEPLFTGSEPSVLPIRRPRIDFRFTIFDLRFPFVVLNSGKRDTNSYSKTANRKSQIKLRLFSFQTSKRKGAATFWISQ